MRTVITAIDALKKVFPLKKGNVKKALRKVKKLTGLHGRWEVIHTKPLLVLDVAHNADGIEQVVQQINLIQHHHLHIIFGMVKDKDAGKVLSLLPKNATYYFTKAQIPRALPENELANQALLFQLAGKTFPDVNKALRSAVKAASKNDMIIVCGSVFIVGEVNRKAIRGK